MRKLASVQRIWNIEPIEGADRIELAHVLGWQCVVNKGQFQPMDLAVYFEVDSFLPIAPEYEFLRASSYRKTDIMGEGFRLRTMKFRVRFPRDYYSRLRLFRKFLRMWNWEQMSLSSWVSENGKSKRGLQPEEP